MNHLYLGLGGAGVRVWQALRRRLACRIEPAGRRAVLEPLLIDTDPKEFRDEAPGWRHLGSSLVPPAQQRLLLGASAAELHALLRARPELRACLAPEGLDWEARLLELGAFDAPLSQVAARLPGWPSRRLGRLLLAHGQGRVRLALDAVSQALQARHTHPSLTLHLVVQLGGATGAGLLIDLLQLLRQHPPATRCSVHLHALLPQDDTAAGRPAPLAEIQAYAVLRELQAAAQEGLFELCLLSARTDERGLQPLDAAGREQRLADWIFQRVSGEPEWLTPPRAAGQAARRGEFAAFGLAERAADRVELRSHLSHELLLRLLAQLRYNHWRPGLGFVTHPRPVPVEAMDAMETLLVGWGLSEAHLQLAAPLPEIDGDSPPGTPIEQEWQALEAHYRQLIELVAPARRATELRRLFEQGLEERFRGQGIDAAFDLPDHALRRRAVVVRQRVESTLWEDWREGRRALHECGQLLAAVLADLADRIEPLRQEQHGLETQAALLWQQIEAAEQAASVRPGMLARLRGQAAPVDVEALIELLREYALARTRSAAVTLTLRLVAEIEAQLTTLQGMIDAGEMELAALVETTDAAAAAALPPARPEAGESRLETRELLNHWRQQLITRETMQREHLRVLRAGLFARLGEQASFRIFAQRIGEAATCDALLAACAQRLPPAQLQPAVAGAWDAWLAGLQAEPERLAREQAALRAQAAVSLLWSSEEAPGASIQECLRVPVPPEPGEAPADETDAADEDEGGGEVAARTATRPAPTLLPADLARLLRRPGGAGTAPALQMRAEGEGALVLMRLVRGLPLQALRPVQELHRLHEAHRLQAGRAALWLQLDEAACLPELLAVDVQAQQARARTVVLLAEALGLLRHEPEPLTGAPVLVHVSLDADGFEIARVRLGRDPLEAVDQARERVLHDLFDEVCAELQSGRHGSPEAIAGLRDRMRDRIEMLRRQSPPTQWDTISRDWNEAAREAMKLIRQECPR